jgi:hypothetical protein
VYRLVRRDFRWGDAPTLELEDAELQARRGDAPLHARCFAPLTREERRARAGAQIWWGATPRRPTSLAAYLSTGACAEGPASASHEPPVSPAPPSGARWRKRRRRAHGEPERSSSPPRRRAAPAVERASAKGRLSCRARRHRRDGHRQDGARRDLPEPSCRRDASRAVGRVLAGQERAAARRRSAICCARRRGRRSITRSSEATRCPPAARPRGARLVAGRAAGDAPRRARDGQAGGAHRGRGRRLPARAPVTRGPLLLRRARPRAAARDRGRRPVSGPTARASSSCTSCSARREPPPSWSCS